jgi:hypothetical protein
MANYIDTQGRFAYTAVERRQVLIGKNQKIKEGAR